MTVIRDVEYLTAYGCRFCLHLFSTAYLFGSGVKGRGPRLEICTPRHWFRFSPGFQDKCHTPKSNCARPTNGPVPSAGETHSCGEK